MSQLYDLTVLIENKIKADGLDANGIEGQDWTTRRPNAVAYFPQYRGRRCGPYEAQAGGQRSAESQRVKSIHMNETGVFA